MGKLGSMARPRPLPFLAAALLGVAIACSEAPPSAPSRAPDVVLVVVDTLRADRTGLLTDGLTPRMSALGARGTAYTTAVAPSSWTLPSIAALFSGEEIASRRTRAFDVPTLAERFAEAGYRTVGLVANPLLTDDNGFTRGFESFDVAPAEATSARLATDEMLSTIRRWDAAALAARAITALEDPARERPLFLYVHMMDPHLPYDPSHVSRGALEAGWSQGELPVSWRDEPLVGDEARTIGRLRRAYDGQVAFVDDALGRLGDALGASSRPWLLGVTSDHGEGMFSHRRNLDSPWAEDEPLSIAYFEHGEQVYEEAVRVPLWLVGEGVPAGRVETRPVAMRDLGATLVQLAALDDDDVPGGRLPLAADDPVPEHVAGTGTRDWFVRSATRKLIVPFDNRRPAGIDDRTFDVASDRYLPELTPLDDAPALHATLDAWRAEHAVEDTPTDPATQERLRRLGYVK